MVSCFFTRLNGSPADAYMTPEQQSGLIRQALSLTSKAMAVPSPSAPIAAAEGEGGDKKNTKKDAATTIDYLEMFKGPIAANFVKKIPNTIAKIMYTKPTTPRTDPAFTAEMVKELESSEWALTYNLEDYLSKLEPKEKVQFTYAVKWDILKQLDAGANRANIVKKYGCKGEDLSRWVKESSTIRMYAENPATANSMRIR